MHLDHRLDQALQQGRNGRQGGRQWRGRLQHGDDHGLLDRRDRRDYSRGWRRTLDLGIASLFFEHRGLELIQDLARHRYFLYRCLNLRQCFGNREFFFGGVLQQRVQVGLQRQLRPGRNVDRTVHEDAHG